MTQTDGKINFVPGYKESILWKWLYYPKQSTDSVLFLSNNKWHFLTELEQKKCIFLNGNTKALTSQSDLENDTRTLDEYKY